jgi:hypothetical protein
MSTTNLILRQLEDQRAEDLSTLRTLSRDLDAYLAGPKEIKIQAAPKYVKGVTKSQGDEEYASNVRAFGAKQLGRAFGMNMNMSAVQQQVLNSFEAKYGSGDSVREFVDLATQVVVHILIQGATHAGAKDIKQLPEVRDLLVNEIINDNSIVKGLEALDDKDDWTIGSGAARATLTNIFKGKTMRWLRPLNLVHIERMDAKLSPRLRSRADMEAYISNGEAQAAVLRYIVKHPVPDDVLLPAAISGTVSDAFLKYPAKDVAATYAYYRKAVEENLYMGAGIQIGDVKASLDAAKGALDKAASNMRDTGINARTSAIFEKGFRKAASDISKIKADSSEADEDIVFVVAGLADLLGAYNNIGESSAAKNANKLKGCGLDASDALGAEVLKVMKALPSEYMAQNANYSETDVAYLDARDEICPVDTATVIRTSPRFNAVINNLSLAFLSLNEAYSLIMPFRSSATRPTGLGEGTLKVTDAFKDLVAEQLKSAQDHLEKTAKAAPSVDNAVFTKAMLEAYDLFLNVRTSSGSTPLTTLSVDPKDWDISDVTFTKIADGRIPRFDTGIEEALLAKVDREFRSTPASAQVRRATRAAVISSATLISDVLVGIRVQAENTGVAMQIRSNPAMSKGHMALAAGGSLVGTHAVSSLANRFVNPASGSMTAHLVDYAPSLAVAGFGAYKAHQGEKDLGYSLLGGALGHIVLRCAFTKYPALRFSDNVVLKALQAPTNGVAHLLGDESMAASALTPASIEGKEDEALTHYILNLVNANDCVSLGYIACQLYKSGLRATGLEYGDPDGKFELSSLGAPTAEIDPVGCCELACALTKLKCVLDAHGVAVVAQSAAISQLDIELAGVVTIDGKEITLKNAARSETCIQRVAACKENMSKILDVPVEDLSGFIQEPGYNMNVYSGEDQVSYLQPAPSMNSMTGIAQLDSAIARAKRLDPQEKLQEGISDLNDMQVIRATSNTARMIEDAGVGTSVGHSRTNPNHELVVLEVEGANGLWPVAPARQHSVPQGALNYAKIGHAEDVTVSPHGLFTRGSFTPMYGR